MYIEDENQDIETIEMPLSPPSSPKCNTSSSVWVDFEKFIDEKWELKAVCKYCKRKLTGASKHGTSYLKNHKKSCPQRRHDFRTFIRNLQPLFKMASRNTIKFDILKIRICLTIDICFVYVPSPHAGDAIADIENNLFIITLDNASYNDVVASSLVIQLSRKFALLLDGKMFRVHCCAHILNLIVQHGIREIKEIIAKIRDIINKKIYMHLMVAFELKETSFRFAQRESMSNLIPSKAEWERASQICECLKNIYDATNVFSGSNSIEYISSMATKLKKKFDKCWRICNLTLAIACAVDRRYKLKLINLYYPLIHGDEATQAITMDIENFSILIWWRANAPRFPILSKMVRDILVIHVSTVASESAFSTNGRVLDQFHSFLYPSTVQALMRTQNWLQNDKEGKTISIFELLVVD
ncbi:hypothetical protein AMTRI_Chr09g18340 [Amborella trichopoda]